MWFPQPDKAPTKYAFSQSFCFSFLLDESPLFQRVFILFYFFVDGFLPVPV